jgi:hypothetical protein
MVAFRTSQVLAYPLVMRDEGQSIKLVRLADPLALRLRTEVNLDTNVVVRQSRGQLICEINLPRSMFAPLTLNNLRPGKGPRVALGESVLKDQVDLSLKDSLTPHALIAGTSGSGKTVLLQTMISQWAMQSSPDRVNFLLIDGKHRGLVPFYGLAHCIHPVIYEPAEAVKALVWAFKELTKRKDMLAEETSLLPRIVIVIDEVSVIISATGGPEGKAAQIIGGIASEGRELGIHVIAATQHPVQEFIGGSMVRANLNTRLLLRVVDAEASKLGGGHANLNGHKLNETGDCILVTGSKVVRFQVALTPPDTFAKLPMASSGRYLPLDQISVEGVSSSPTVQAPTERADPITPEQIAWTIANRRWVEEDGETRLVMPGINATAAAFGIGNNKATRVKAQAQALIDALAEHGCAVYRNEEDDDDEESS